MLYLSASLHIVHLVGRSTPDDEDLRSSSLFAFLFFNDHAGSSFIFCNDFGLLELSVVSNAPTKSGIPPLIVSSRLDIVSLAVSLSIAVGF